MKWFAEYLEDPENRRKLTTRLGVLLIVGGTIMSIVLWTGVILLKK